MDKGEPTTTTMTGLGQGGARQAELYNTVQSRSPNNSSNNPQGARNKRRN